MLISSLFPLQVGKSHSFLYHSACIWGLESYPGALSDGKKAVLPPGSFVTCGSDDTIRIWNMDAQMPTNTLYRRNIYSEELLKTLYIDPELGFIKEADTSLQAGEKDTLYDQRNGVRCIRISPNGKHLASGDRSGNIRSGNITLNHVAQVAILLILCKQIFSFYIFLKIELKTTNTLDEISL